MSRNENTLPQLSGNLFITDGGLETTLVYHNGIDLPCFATFALLKNEAGYQTLKNYYAGYAGLAKKFNAGLILESPTWRANPDWGKILGYSDSELAEMNRKSIQLMKEIRDEFRDELPGMVSSGCIGPRGDGYQPSAMMSVAEAERYHLPQIETFSGCGADMVTAITMNSANSIHNWSAASGISISLAAVAAPITGTSAKSVKHAYRYFRIGD
jgi:S-methylmethionine-dependent homocysteine/selenocysteine methylase